MEIKKLTQDNLNIVKKAISVIPLPISYGADKNGGERDLFYADDTYFTRCMISADAVNVTEILNNTPRLIAALEEARQAPVDIIMWLRGEHPGSNTTAWEATIRPIFDDIANHIEKKYCK